MVAPEFIAPAQSAPFRMAANSFIPFRTSIQFSIACRCTEQSAVNLTLQSQIPYTKPFSELSDGAGGLKCVRVEVNTIKEGGWKKSINSTQEQEVFSYNTRLAAILKDARANRKSKQNPNSDSASSSSSRPSSSNTAPREGKSQPETSNSIPSSLSPLQQALRLYKEMKSLSIAADFVTLSTLMSVCVESRHVQQAKWVESEAQRLSLQSLPLYSAFMQCLCEQGRQQEALQAYRRLQAHTNHLDAHCCTLVLTAMVGLGDTAAAEKELDQWLQNGVRLTTWTFTKLMQAYARNGAFEDAVRTFQRMQSCGCDADVTAYNVLMSAYARDGFSTGAAEVMNQIRSDGLHPDTVSFNTLLSAYVRAGEPARAHKAFLEMPVQAVTADIVTYQLMMRAYNMMGWYHKAYVMRKKFRQLKRQLA